MRLYSRIKLTYPGQSPSLDSPSSRGLLPQGYASQPESTRLRDIQPCPASNGSFPKSYGGSFPWDRDIDSKRCSSYSQLRSPRTRSWSFSSTAKLDTSLRRNSEYGQSRSPCHRKTGDTNPVPPYPHERVRTEQRHSREAHLGPEPPQNLSHQFPLEIRSVGRKPRTTNTMARGIELPRPNEYQSQPGLGLPIDETKLTRKRRQIFSQATVHPTDDISFSNSRSSQTNESTHTSWSGEDGVRKHDQAMVAHKVAERNRRLEQDAKKKVIERLLPESSLDKKNNKWGSTKAGILEGAILVLDGLPMETKVEAVKKTLTRKERSALAHECVETRAGRRCAGACSLVRLPSMHTPPPSKHSSPGDERCGPHSIADERMSLSSHDHSWMAPIAPVHY